MSATTVFDRMLAGLGHPYRRRLLVALTEHNPQTAPEPRRTDRESDASSDSDLRGETSATAIRHVHLPKLADLGYVSWDEASGQISKGENWSEIEPLVRLLVDHGADLDVEWR